MNYQTDLFIYLFILSDVQNMCDVNFYFVELLQRDHAF